MPGPHSPYFLTFPDDINVDMFDMAALPMAALPVEVAAAVVQVTAAPPLTWTYAGAVQITTWMQNNQLCVLDLGWRAARICIAA